MSEKDVKKTGAEDPHYLLEKTHILNYLSAKGYTLEKLKELPEAEAKALLAEASIYASAKMAEVETRAKFIDNIQDLMH